MILNKGTLVISLDFELMWGMLGTGIEKKYRTNIIGEKEVISKLLQLFSKYNIHATWATVGLIFCDNINEIKKFIPKVKPNYENKKFSPYPIIDELNIQNEDYLYFAPSLIKDIINTPNQEIATHTFSHYYCMEKGQDINSFREDIISAIEVARKNKVEMSSIIFPRNQVVDDYLVVCRELGIKSFRGTEKSWMYKTKKYDSEVFYRRGFRFIDTYINLSGHNCYSFDSVKKDPIVNIPSSRFLRPYSKRFKWLEFLRLKRICNDLKYSAQNNQIFHLWWHPHNMGKNIDENLRFLEKILIYYSELRKNYGMQSLNMNEIVQ